MGKLTILALCCLLIWLIIFSRELIRWRKEKENHKVFKDQRPPWLTFFLMAGAIKLLEKIEFQRYTSKVVENAVLQFLVEVFLIGLVSLSPQILIILLKKISKSFK
jgi:hypothetical protein